MVTFQFGAGFDASQRCYLGRRNQVVRARQLWSSLWSSITHGLDRLPIAG